LIDRSIGGAAMRGAGKTAAARSARPGRRPRRRAPRATSLLRPDPL